MSCLASSQGGSSSPCQSSLFAEIDQLLATSTSPSSPSPVSDIIASYLESPPRPVMPKPIHDRRQLHPNFQPKPLLLVRSSSTFSDDDIPLSLLRSARSIKQPLPTHTRRAHSISTPQRQLLPFLEMPTRSAPTSSPSSACSSTASSLLLATPPPHIQSHSRPPAPQAIINGQVSDKMRARHRHEIDLITNGPRLDNRWTPGSYSPSYPVLPYWNGSMPVPVFCSPPTDPLAIVIGDLKQELKGYQIEDLEKVQQDMNQQLVQRAKQMIAENHGGSNKNASHPGPHFLAAYGLSSPSR